MIMSSRYIEKISKALHNPNGITLVAIDQYKYMCPPLIPLNILVVFSP